MGIPVIAVGETTRRGARPRRDGDMLKDRVIAKINAFPETAWTVEAFAEALGEPVTQNLRNCISRLMHLGILRPFHGQRGRYVKAEPGYVYTPNTRTKGSGRKGIAHWSRPVSNGDIKPFKPREAPEVVERRNKVRQLAVAVQIDCGVDDEFMHRLQGWMEKAFDYGFRTATGEDVTTGSMVIMDPNAASNRGVADSA
jgi:hypothetical protein